MAVQRKPAPKTASRNSGLKVKKAWADHSARGKIDKPAKGVTVRELRETFGVSRQVFSRLSQFSERAIAKWEAGEPLSPPSKQRMTELQRLQVALSQVMEADFVSEWLQSPNKAFGGLKPLEVVERGEIDKLWRMIYLLESGAPS